MVPVKLFMVPREKFITVERDTNAQTAARIMRDRDRSSKRFKLQSHTALWWWRPPVMGMRIWIRLTAAASLIGPCGFGSHHSRCRVSTEQRP
jgi:hypothetical protein